MRYSLLWAELYGEQELSPIIKNIMQVIVSGWTQEDVLATQTWVSEQLKHRQQPGVSKGTNTSNTKPRFEMLDTRLCAP